MFTRLPQIPLQHRSQRPIRTQGGVVLIMALIMLVVISLLAVMSVRNATSSESVNANVRQMQLASQSAETALRYCEDAVLNLVSVGTPTFNITSPPSSTTVAFDASYVQDVVYSGTSTTVLGTPTSMVAANWDSIASGNKILVLPDSTVNRSGITATFSRSPECMVERLSPSTSSTYSANFTITSRGFGPEVAAADSSRTRPVGSVVWLQSTIGFQ
jgi:type IV pilus assembly protein PilX